MTTEKFSARKSPEDRGDLRAVIGLHRDAERLSAAAQQAEDVEEEVDEVEIKDKTTHQRDFHGRFFVCLVKLMHQAFDFLGVISREPCEDEHTSNADEEIESGTSEEHVHHKGNDESDDCHREDAAYHGEVFLDEKSYNGHRAKCACRDEKGVDNFGLRVD